MASDTDDQPNRLLFGSPHTDVYGGAGEEDQQSGRAHLADTAPTGLKQPMTGKRTVRSRAREEELRFLTTRQQRERRLHSQAMLPACASLGDTWGLSTLEDKIMFMDLAGKDSRAIRDNLKEAFGIELSMAKITAIVQAVHGRIYDWQTRNLEPTYPLVHFDDIQATRSRFDTGIRYSCVAVAVTVHGAKDVLGIWTTTESSVALRHRILAELQQRGVRDILMILADRPKEFHDPVIARFSDARIHTALAGFIRTSLRMVQSSRRLQLSKDMKTIYQAADRREAEVRLDELLGRWSVGSPALARYWRDSWATFAPLCAIPHEVRKVLAMLNVIESLNSSLRKVTRNRQLLDNDADLFQAFFLTLHSFAAKWPRSLRDWNSTHTWLSTTFPDRMPRR
jgi:putative transposase